MPQQQLPGDQANEDDRDARAQQEAGRRTPDLGHEPGEKATDRRRAGEDGDIQRHHPAAQLVRDAVLDVTLMVLTISIEEKPMTRISGKAASRGAGQAQDQLEGDEGDGAAQDQGQQRTPPAREGQAQRADQRARAQRGKERAVAIRLQAKRVASEERQQGLEVHGEGGHPAQQHQRPEDGGRAHCVADPLSQAVTDRWRSAPAARCGAARAGPSATAPNSTAR